MAGGIITHNFLEVAPLGNTHLYPPLFHLLLLIPYRLGLNLLFIARLFSSLSFALFLVVLYFVIAKLFSKRKGFFVTAAACLPYTFFLKASITMPANLALIFILLTFLAIEREKLLAASLLLSACFYSHLGLPWLGALSFLIYGFFRREKLRFILKTLILAFLFSSPFLWYLLSNLYRFEGVFGLGVAENKMFEIYLTFYLFAIIGFLQFKKHQFSKRGLFFISLFIGLLPMAVNYRYRLISAEGLLPVIFFCGLGLEKAFEEIAKFFKAYAFKLSLKKISFVLIFFLINVFSPSLTLQYIKEPPYEERELLFYLRDSTFINLLPLFKKHFRPLEVSLYDKYMKELVEIILNHTEQSDVIYVNYRYIGGMLSAISERASSTRTFYEVKPPPYLINKITSAKLAILLKDPIHGLEGRLNLYLDNYKFKKAAQTEIATVLLNPSAPRLKPTKPLIYLSTAYTILLVSSLLILFDFRRTP